ncbi:peptidoglycan/xylan/chitin deacetylase (PgdA/CDA1 family) [Dyadobacter sp. BE34]|uniref:Peptidoglycan/xylan/chitin deacetylase (PgdA/CDA1 family) n=1 Tax=Dyadobacter fermentans TaxID=94254 RepID=A0ABU1QZ23_9BACT|nr:MULTISPECIES: polysaccharide deacetylase family protein [Dyadobacter]MDR6805985.1 peptidoglycan/xylan/chitin deacetylase (PgdA/CDA1 family) [Dyadobacter fermentans]MDR7043725.1 peptidoglycan/xylan/chitin deacetylase (PgdA/CDA1 family) [Dyadobacter sp. BE242]MDR7198037.1 peptidoglycan/xylan/chitin deacetylase (PgdA/CDA1 family) [Dyadobacter sp. BE34]MDR7215999.1 peptidoglycan/xylan/chitin deacetylase (PgdA/CDA1 family) [Dyadobacter sp. BE31]MDR7264475.1 peptidoglycan/xylan/chitin deacetylase
MAWSVAAYSPVSKADNLKVSRHILSDNEDQGFSRVRAYACWHWAEFVKGLDEDIATNKKLLALTFDACGGPHGSGYDVELILYLEKMKIPATLFVTGKWIDANYATFLNLSKNSLFEIENHGLNHRPCSEDGESEYGIKPTPDVPDSFDEIEANERKITAITGRRPIFFRSATAFTDEACAKIAQQLGVKMMFFPVTRSLTRQLILSKTAFSALSG